MTETTDVSDSDCVTSQARRRKRQRKQ